MEIFEGAIGIDLGTTYSCVAVFRNDTVEVIANDQGNRTTPSCVAFHNNDILVGDAAKHLAARGVKGVVYDAKRMIGRKFSDKVIRDDATRWPFTIEAGENDNILLCVDHRGEILKLQPEEISARVLTYLKSCAESYLGKQVKKVVVTVPAYFNDSQRERTKTAARIAGLEVLRIVNEPTAAALCYGLGIGAGAGAQGTENPVNVLVFDFGGGTFDVSIITIDCGSFAVRATAGDTHLGGQDVDAALLSYVIKDLKNRHGVDATEQPRLMAKLLARCEQAKRVLSHAASEEIVLDGVLPNGEEYAINISRAKLEELCNKVFSRCITVVQKAMKDASMGVDDIEDVILVGGSSRIPAIRNMLQNMFKGKRLCNSVHPDEAVAIGAAVQASIVGAAPEQQSSRTADVVLMDVVPLSIGVEIDEGKFDPIIRRNTTIPYQARKEYSTVEDGQAEVEVKVFEGERPLTRDCHELGAFTLDGITRAPAGEPTVTVTFDVDADGILTVTAAEKLAGAAKSLTVANTERLTDAAVQQMIETAERLSASDALALAVMDASQEVTRGLDEVENALAARGELPLSHKLQRRVAFLSHGRKWVEKQLPNYTQPQEIEAKVAKIMKLVKKAMKTLRKEKHTNGDGKRGADGEEDDDNDEEENNTDEEEDDESDKDSNSDSGRRGSERRKGTSGKKRSRSETGSVVE